MRHYVYVHRRADDGRVFYVGKGSHPGRAHGLKMKTLYNWLSGHRPNPTSLELA